MWNELKAQIFHKYYLIGIRYKKILETKLDNLLPFESDPTCQMIINFTDRIKPNEENQAGINRSLGEIAQTEQRTTHENHWQIT